MHEKNNKSPVMKRIDAPSISPFKGSDMRIPHSSNQARSAAGRFKGTGSMKITASGSAVALQDNPKPLIRKLSEALFKR